MAIHVGIAPDSWGVWFPEHEKEPPWWRCLDEMKIAGYEGCEIGPWGYMPNDDPAVLKNAIDARGLTLVGATVGGNFLDDTSVDEMCKTIDDIAALLKSFPSAKYIVLLPPMYTDLETGSLAMNPNLSDEEWKKYAANVQKCADRVAENGFVGVFYPHVDSHVQTEADILCFDTGHHVYADRMIATESLPVKKKMDEEKWSFARAVYEDIMVEPGKGSIDFKKFYEALVEKNYDGWCVVEQDLFPVKSFDLPLKLAKIGRENLREAGFK